MKYKPCYVIKTSKIMENFERMKENYNTVCTGQYADVIPKSLKAYSVFESLMTHILKNWIFCELVIRLVWLFFFVFEWIHYKNTMNMQAQKYWHILHSISYWLSVYASVSSVWKWINVGLAYLYLSLPNIFFLNRSVFLFD